MHHSSELDGRVPNDRRRSLVAAATKLRSLVRVKIADDADLAQAGESLKLAHSLFNRLARRAGATQCRKYDMWQRLAAHQF